MTATPPSEGAGEQRVPPLVLELRIGNAGDRADQLLAEHDTGQLLGDRRTGVHRVTRDLDAERRPRDYAGRPVVEAYRWSRLYPSLPGRLLLLPLLPFTLVNLAFWMRPQEPEGVRTRAGRVYSVAVRLLGLSLTLLLTLSLTAMFLDTYGWQCGDTVTCDSGRAPWGDVPGRTLLLPAAVLCALAALPRLLPFRSSAMPAERLAEVRAVRRPEELALSRPGFWNRAHLMSELRPPHSAAVLGTAAAFLLLPTLEYDAGHGGPLRPTGLLLAALIGLLAVAVTVVVARGPGRTGPAKLLHPLPGAALLLLLAAACCTAWPRPGWRRTGQLPGLDGAFTLLFLAQGILVLLALGAAARLRTAPPRPEPARGTPEPYGSVPDLDPVSARLYGTALRGLGGPAVLVVACWLGWTYSAGAASLFTGGPAGAGATPAYGTQGIPTLLAWQTVTTVPAVSCAVLALGYALTLRMGFLQQRLVPQVEATYDVHRLVPWRSQEIARAIAVARLTDRAPGAVAWLALTGGTALTAAAVPALGTGTTPVRAAEGAPDLLRGTLSALSVLSVWLLGAMLLSMLAASRSRAGRRGWSALWQLIGFWPSAVHPYVFGGHGSRTVTDIVWRLHAWLTTDAGRKAVLNAHGQGSVIAFAAVLQCSPHLRGRIALFTHGTPLRRLHARYFPAFVGPHALREVALAVPVWRNLWRRTDPVGGPLDLPPPADHVDAPPLVDPLAYGRTLEQPLSVPVRGHAKYHVDPAYAEERAAVLARLRGW